MEVISQLHAPASLPSMEDLAINIGIEGLVGNRASLDAME
jgi:hypothetical protein